MLDITEFDAALKENYNDDVISDAVPKSHPLLSHIPKDESFTGETWIEPIKISNVQSIGSGSGAFSDLVTSPGNSETRKFVLVSTKHYGTIQLDRETMLASVNNVGAFVNALDYEVNNMIDGIGQNFARQLYGDGSGALGSFSAFASHVGTLSNLSDIVNFEVGMKLDTYTSGGSAQDSDLVVTKVDEPEGKITVTGDSLTAATDVAYRANSKDQELKGLKAWLPEAVPSATAFYGVDRTESSRLYGQFQNGSSGDLDDLILKMLMKVNKQGGKVSHIFMSFERYSAYLATNHDRIRILSPVDKASIGFPGVQVATPYGECEIYADRYCPDSKVYLLTMSSWRLVSRGKLVQWISEDGATILRASGADAFQGRSASYCFLSCRAPIANAVIHSLPSAY